MILKIEKSRCFGLSKTGNSYIFNVAPYSKKFFNIPIFLVESIEDIKEGEKEYSVYKVNERLKNYSDTMQIIKEGEINNKYKLYEN